jgi:prophage maintenance system killer protein
LLKGIVQEHPFASGNRRTAFVVAKDFLRANSRKTGIKNDPDDSNALQGIRERFYSDAEIKEWILNGKIRTFNR